MACSRLSVCSESLFGICHTLEEDLPRPGGGGGTGFMCQEDCHPQVDLSPKSFPPWLLFHCHGVEEGGNTGSCLAAPSPLPNEKVKKLSQWQPSSVLLAALWDTEHTTSKFVG